MKVVITPRGFAKCGTENVEFFEAAGICLVYNQTGKTYIKEEFHRLTEDADGIVVGTETVDMGCVCNGLKYTERQVSICAKDTGGPYTSHGYERSHIDGIYNTLKLLCGYTEV